MPDDVKDTLVGILLGDSFVRKVVYLGLCSFLFVPFLLLPLLCKAKAKVGY